MMNLSFLVEDTLEKKNVDETIETCFGLTFDSQIQFLKMYYNFVHR